MVGWYCPFSIPPIIDSDNINIIQIVPSDETKAYFGSTRLCKKLSAVLRYIGNDCLDGLVMANCCNLSMNIYKYLTELNPGLSIIFMDIPRRADESFTNRLIKEWSRLERWVGKLDNLSITRNSSYEANIITRNNPNEYVNHSDYQCGIWCQMPENISSTGNKSSWAELIENLIDNVNCPRIINDGLRGCYSRIIKHDMDFLINNSDSDCVIQSYFIMCKQKGRVNE